MRYFVLTLLVFSVNLFAQIPTDASAPIAVPSVEVDSAKETIVSTTSETALTRTAQFKKDTIPVEQFSIPYVLILLCLLFSGFWWWIKRKSPNNILSIEDTSLKIIKRQRLSTKTILHVVQYREYELLIAEHAQGVTVLEKTMNTPSKPSQESDAQ